MKVYCTETIVAADESTASTHVLEEAEMPEADDPAAVELIEKKAVGESPLFQRNNKSFTDSSIRTTRRKEGI